MMRAAVVLLLGISGVSVAVACSEARGEYTMKESRELAGYYCKSHKPSHHAKSPGQVQAYTRAHGCSNWASVSLGTISGVLKGPTGNPVGGAQVSLLANDKVVLGTTVSASNGSFTFGNVPRAGTYEVQVATLGYSVLTQLIDASDEKIEIALPGEVQLEL